MSDYQYREFTLPDDSFCFREDGPRLYLEGLVVPYMTPTEIVEPRGDGFVAYREQFAAGAFDRTIRAPFRVTLQYSHSRSLSERLGSGASFSESAAGLVGEFLLDRSRAEQARDVVETSHAAMSVGFQSIYPAPLTERDGQLVTRKSVHLDHVALVPVGAYPEARILAMSARGETDGEPTDAELAEQKRQAEEAELLAMVEELKVTQLELESRYAAGK